MPAVYRIRNWSSYNRALVGRSDDRPRGDLTVWLSDDALDAWHHTGEPQQGGQFTYSDLAIETCLMMRSVYHLALRQTQGFVRSLLRVMGADRPVPDYSTLSRRAAALDVALSRSTSGDDEAGPRHIVIDSTGLKVYGEGEWKGVSMARASVGRGGSCIWPSTRRRARSPRPS